MNTTRLAFVGTTLVALLAAACGGSAPPCKCTATVSGATIELACDEQRCEDGRGYACSSAGELALDDSLCEPAPIPDMKPAKDLADDPADCSDDNCDTIGAECGTAYDHCGGSHACGSCGTGTLCSKSNKCVSHCANSKKDGDESDTDCGGACAPCGANRICTKPSDCATGTQCEDGVCLTGSYTTLEAMPTPRNFAAVAVSPDGKIYVAGGGSTALKKVEVYNPATNGWSSATDMLTARSEGSAIFASDGRLYVAGGQLGAAGAAKSVEFYDTTTKIWTAAPALSIDRVGGTLVTTSTGKLAMLGGASGTYGNYLDSATVETLAQDGVAWQSLALTLVHARHSFGAAAIGDGSYILAGGLRHVANPGYDPGCISGFCPTKQNEMTFGKVERCWITEQSADSCESYGEFPNASKAGPTFNSDAFFDVGAVSKGDGKVYFFGNLERKTGAPATYRAWQLDLATKQWQSIASNNLGPVLGAVTVASEIYVLTSSGVSRFTP